MSNAIGDIILTELTESLESWERAITMGQPLDYPTYREGVGVIRTLRGIKERFEELQKRQHDGVDEDE